jgi:hypothetical protein
MVEKGMAYSSIELKWFKAITILLLGGIHHGRQDITAESS